MGSSSEEEEEEDGLLPFCYGGRKFSRFKHPRSFSSPFFPYSSRTVNVPCSQGVEGGGGVQDNTGYIKLFIKRRRRRRRV